MTHITNDQKKPLVQQRLAQFAAEKYQHELNRQLGEAVGDTTAIQQADDAITILDTAITLHEAELERLG